MPELAEAGLSNAALKLQAKRELQIALTAFGEHFAEGRGIGGVETYIRSAAATAAPAPIRVVPNVKGFCTELKPETLIHGNGFEQAEVPVLESGLIDEVANALGVECPRSGLGEDGRSVGICGGEPLAIGTKGANNLRMAVNDPVLSINAAPEVGIQAYA